MHTAAPLRLVEFEHDGEDRLLIIGPDCHGALRELVAVPADSSIRLTTAAIAPGRSERAPEAISVNALTSAASSSRE